MVVGYDCSECGYQHECDVDESGERICPECGGFVNGITGSVRGSGTQFKVVVVKEGDKLDVTELLTAVDAEQAYGRAKSIVDNAERVKRIVRE